MLQCFLPRLLVHSMMNINLPTIDTYHTQNISILTTLLLGPIFEVMERVVEIIITAIGMKQVAQMYCWIN